MLRSLCRGITLLAACLLVLAPAAALGGGIIDRKNVTVKRNHRTGPTLPSEMEPQAREPSDYELAVEEYYREQAEYYRERRLKSQRERGTRSGGGSCMYGPDGSVIYAPAGRDCDSPPASR